MPRKVWAALSAGLRRFVQRDPLEYVDGPNAYAYVSGRPLGHRDPTGLSDDDEVAPPAAGAPLPPPTNTVTLYVDASDFVGHSFLGLTTSGGAQYVVGLYPDHSAACCGKLSFAFGAPGNLQDDSGHPYTSSSSKPISDAEAAALIAAINGDNEFPPDYAAFGFNCVSWDRDKYNSVGGGKIDADDCEGNPFPWWSGPFYLVGGIISLLGGTDNPGDADDVGTPAAPGSTAPESTHKIK